jgi:hypothetical protein
LRVKENDCLEDARKILVRTYETQSSQKKAQMMSKKYIAKHGGQMIPGCGTVADAEMNAKGSYPATIAANSCSREYKPMARRAADFNRMPGR